MDADRDAGVVGAVVDRVREQVAQRGGELVLVAEDGQPVLPAHLEPDLARLGLQVRGVDGLGHHVVDVDDARLAQRVVALQARERDEVLHHHRQPVRLVLHPEREPAHRLGVVGRARHRLRQQRQRADGGLQLVADVGHEVATDGVQPPDRRLVLGEQQDVVAERSEPDVENEQLGAPVSARDLDLELAHLTVPAHLAGQQHEGLDPQPAAPDQAVRQGRRAGPDDPVAAVEHDPRRAQRREHRLRPGRQGR